MAETLISPGVLARENDQSQVTSQPVQAGACIVGPTVLGRVNIPKLVTTYSEYLSNFGSTFSSGSDTYTYFTSISAYNYFNNGGTSLIVNRVASGSWTPANTTADPIRNNVESGNLTKSPFNMTGSIGTTGQGGNSTSSPFLNKAVVGTTGTTVDVVRGFNLGKFTNTTNTANLKTTIIAGTEPTPLSNNTFTGVPITVGANSTATIDVVIANNSLADVGSTVTINSAGSGYANGETGTIAEGAFGSGMFVVGAGPAPAGGTGYGNTLSSGALTITSAMVDTAGAEGGTINFTTNGAGAIVSCVLAIASSKGYVNGSVITVPEATLQGSGLDAGGAGNTVVTLTAGNVQNSAAGTFTIAGNVDQTVSNLLVETTSVTLNTQNAADSFTAGQVLEVAAADIGTTTAPPGSNANLQITLQNQDLIDEESFTIETLTDGTIMNSGTGTGTNGTLTNGTVDNIRWEIQGSDTATGTFSLIVRQGNDTATAKRILEIFPNVSLDPKQSNYISRIVGDMKKVFNGAGTSDPYISTEGSFPNASRYIRVSNVAFPTPDYFDNNGTAKAIYANYMPDISSGSFSGATGELYSKSTFPSYTQALFYDKISDANTQGMTSTEMTVYTDAFNLLGNKDDYSYNIITAPGLYYASSMMATPMNTLIQNTQTRGDAIAIVDLVSYSGGTVATAKTQAASIDNSYAAAYWPWVQLNDPDSRQLVWAVPSAVIPGVYAFNDRTSEAWFAPAGINRGGLSTVVQAQRKLTQTNRDDLYTGKVNPIATFPGKGVVVFGQKTLQSQASALDRINVRRLLIALKSFIVQIADNLVFEQNTAATRNNFLSQVNPYLESVQQRQGLYAFKVVMDASNNGPDVVDRNQMVGAIYIQPTKTAEFIYLDFNILPTGAQFPS